MIYNKKAPHKSGALFYILRDAETPDSRPEVSGSGRGSMTIDYKM